MSHSIKILIAGSFGEYSLENIYAKHLIDFGYNVIKHDIVKPIFEVTKHNIKKKLALKFYPNIIAKSINDDFIEQAEKIRPDLILVFKGMYLYPSTISASKYFTKILANYNPDHPFNFYSTGSGNRNVRNSNKYYDIHFSYSKKIVNKFKVRYNKEAFFLPFGYDNTLMPSNIPLENVTNNFIFVGAWDHERELFFNKLYDENIKIFGNSAWQSKTILYPKVKKMYQGFPLLKEDLLQASRDSLGCLNILRRQNLIENSHNMRTFEVTGYGGLLISQRTEEQSEFFEENTEAIFFNEVNELKEKLKFLKNNLNVVDKIKKAAYERSIKSNYSYYHRSKQLCQIIDSFF